jgi:uncharacterized protein YdeI (YjbR/CyaY-like superfamily)
MGAKTAEKAKAKAKATAKTTAAPEMSFADRDRWAAWLASNHQRSRGLWLRLAKGPAAPRRSLTYAEAVEVALIHGWIDGQKKSGDAGSWLQKFTPRGPKSLWSKINCGKAEGLIAAGRMHAAGLAAVARAKEDGRWAAAYDSSSRATVPDDLAAALDANAKARDAFATLNAANRYAILFRVHTAKKAETRARRIEKLVAMLARGERLHP